ncbi:hypothetical protein FHS18_005622 [Paenibacillus phyllosphaerae]|uniref:Uncharacterized protein n=1 Tax=Paenibacillus phyllosphaerae TaxID=274593 RepID=A0A7W5B306_9BACL|nr:hypothetical protein [Paenibacillus phyllosphaerae]MBB3113510.1 hypothetical protein [Paenibacillus phyllosphaerae]
MSRTTHQVEYGYEPPADHRKGTLIFYDAFEHILPHELDEAAAYADTRAFSKLVLYPLHEETVRRMVKTPVRPYYKRVDELHAWKDERDLPYVTIEALEGKRKKYTPIDAALRHMAEIYKAPFVLYITPETANLFASYTSFEEWIVKLRLVLIERPSDLHPKLEKYRHRWSVSGEKEETRNG